MSRIHEMDDYRTALRKLIVCEEKDVRPSRWEKGRAVFQNIVALKFGEAWRDLTGPQREKSPTHEPALHWGSAKIIKGTISAFRDLHGYTTIEEAEVPMAILQRIDKLRLYGDRMHRLHSDVAGGNIIKTMALVMAQNHGLEAAVINRAIDNPDPNSIPVIGLAPWYTTMQQFIHPNHKESYCGAVGLIAGMPAPGDKLDHF